MKILNKLLEGKKKSLIGERLRFKQQLWESASQARGRITYR